MLAKLNQIILYIICIMFSLTVTKLRNNEIVDITLIMTCVLSTISIILYIKEWNIKKYIKENWIILVYVFIRIISIILLDNKIANLKSFAYEIYFLFIIQQFYNCNRTKANLPLLIIIIINFIFNIIAFIGFILGVDNYLYIIYSNPNPMGSITCLSLLIYITFFAKKNNKVVSSIYIIFSLIIIYLSKSRTPLCMILAYIIMNLVVKYKWLSSMQLKRYFMHALNIFIIAVICFSYFNKNNQIPTNIETKIYNVTTNRYYLWKYSIISLEDSPLIGVGASKIGEERFKEVPVSMYKYITSSRLERLHLNNNHNGFIQLLASNGYIAYIAFWLWLYNKVKKLDIKNFYIVSSILILNLFENLLIMSPSIHVFLLIYLLVNNDKNKKRTDEVLYINYIDMNNASSGSSVRPHRIYDAFIEEKYNVKLLSGDILKTNKKHRVANVREVSQWLDTNIPKYCYIESPPSEPILYKEDRELIKKIHNKGIKIGYFYRDAYYELGKDFVFNNKKVSIFSKKYLKYIYYKLLFFRDRILLYNNVDIVYFPSLSMSKYFNFKDMRALPPAGEIIDDINDTNGKSVIYVGGISKQYGIDLLLESMNIVNKKQHINLNLVCREKELYNISSEYKDKEWLKIFNISGKEALKKIYSDSKIALIATKRSIYNNFAIPTKLFEYMQYNLPIIATDNFEVKKIIEKYNIGIITEENPEAYAKAILKLYNDEELYLKYKSNEKEALLTENLWKHRINEINENLTNLKE